MLFHSAAILLSALLAENDSTIECVLPIDIERKISLLKVWNVPATSATFLAFFLVVALKKH